MRISIDAHTDTPEHLPEDWADDDISLMAWSVAISDDYSDAEPRVMLTVEEVGRPGAGLTLHLDPAGARHLRSTLAEALKQIGVATD